MTGSSAPARSTALPLREGRAPVRDRLIAMLFLTALLHAIVILGVGFSAGGHGGAREAPQLDVVLVTDEVPQARANPHAAYLAQRTQLGAGDTDSQQPGSPASRGALAAAAQPLEGNDQSSAGAQQTPHDERVLTSTGPSPDIRYFGEQPAPAQAAALPEPLGDTAGAPLSGRGDALELLLRGKSNAAHWVSPDTRASALAPYLADWKRKVERVGTLNFPSAARRAGLSGSPVVEVEIGADGRLRQMRVRRSSGYDALDQAALTILRLASPFNPFPATLAAQYSRLRFAYQWDFVAGTLQTRAATATPETGH
ncbi:MAG TPA: TonB family protein [Steroidobacteraceae bacterium]|nr:TonB family protein [Steroidobacteraceae bacterium]